MNMTRYDTSRSLTRHVPIYVSPSVVENHGPVNSTKLFISRSVLLGQGASVFFFTSLNENQSEKLLRFALCEICSPETEGLKNVIYLRNTANTFWDKQLYFHSFCRDLSSNEIQYLPRGMFSKTIELVYMYVLKKRNRMRNNNPSGPLKRRCLLTWSLYLQCCC